MSLDVVRLVSGDDKPVVVLTLKDDISGQPYDLTPVDTEVFVQFRAAGSTDTPTTITCQKLGSGSDGRVEFNFTGGVLDVPPGMYEGEIVIKEAGFTQRVYDTLRFRVRENFGELPN